MLGCAPFRVTESAAAAVARAPASSTVPPAASAAAKAPFQTSPAAVVSTAPTAGAGQWRSRSGPTRSAPRGPSFATTRRAPRARSVREAAATAGSSASESGLVPASAASSVSFGVT
jgi:hypothetical protein